MTEKSCPVCHIADPIPYEEARRRFLARHHAFYRLPAAEYIEPFRIYGNLWYVGDKMVCSHLLDTGDGLILFDSGYCNATFMLLESIRRAGFDPADVKILIHSHGHFDHFGGGNDLRRLFGCKVYMGSAETAVLREKPESSLVALGPVVQAELCWPDAELSDGDVIRLGNTEIRCVLAPGHTLGTMCFFFDAADGEEKKRVAYWGGVGYLTVFRAHCREYGLPEDMADRLLASIDRLWEEEADIVLGNHPDQNCTLEKRQWMLGHPGENPFLDPDGWHLFLSELRRKTLLFRQLGY